MSTEHVVTIKSAVKASGRRWQLTCTCEMPWPEATTEEQAASWARAHVAHYLPQRQHWDSYFLDGARWASQRADCTRAKHGAMVVKDHRVVSTGYNGGPSGGKSCLKGECPRGHLSHDECPPLSSYDDPDSPGFCIAIHAEANALVYANRADTEGATIYITGQPCHGCRKLIAAAGIRRIVWPDGEETL